MEFSQQTVERAVQAVALGAITPAGLTPLARRSGGAAEFAADGAVREGRVRWLLSEASAEDELMWLFKVGVVRREVDGQGITERFRLTPLGLKAVERLAQGPQPVVSLGDQLGLWWARRFG